MSTSKFSEAEISMLWLAGLQSGLLGRVDAAELSKVLDIPIQRARSIVNNLIEIGFFEPTTRRMDSSKLPAMRWSAPMTGEEFDAYIDEICGNARLS